MRRRCWPGTCVHLLKFRLRRGGRDKDSAYLRGVNRRFLLRTHPSLAEDIYVQDGYHQELQGEGEEMMTGLIGANGIVDPEVWTEISIRRRRWGRVVRLMKAQENPGSEYEELQDSDDDLDDDSGDDSGDDG